MAVKKQLKLLFLYKTGILMYIILRETLKIPKIRLQLTDQTKKTKKIPISWS